METAKLLQKLSSEGLRAYHVVYARFLDSVSDALLWEYLCSKADVEGRIKASETDILVDLGFKRDALRGCRERLSARGVMSYTTVRGGVGKTDTTYYIDQQKFAEQFVAWLEEGASGGNEREVPAVANSDAAFVVPSTAKTQDAPAQAQGPTERAAGVVPAKQQLSSAELEALALADEWSGMVTVQKSAPIQAAPVPANAPEKKGRRGSAKNAELFPIALAIIEVTGSDRNVHMGQAMKAAGAIAKSEKVTPTAALINEKYGSGGWWYTSDWRGKKGQIPTFWTIQQTWATWVGPDSNGSRVVGGVSMGNGVTSDDILQWGVPGFGMPAV